MFQKFKQTKVWYFYIGILYILVYYTPIGHTCRNLVFQKGVSDNIWYTIGAWMSEFGLGNLFLLPNFFNTFKVIPQIDSFKSFLIFALKKIQSYFRSFNGFISHKRESVKTEKSRDGLLWPRFSGRDCI